MQILKKSIKLVDDLNTLKEEMEEESVDHDNKGSI